MILDMSKVVFVLISNADGPQLAIALPQSFDDLIAAHVEFSVNDELREKIEENRKT